LVSSTSKCSEGNEGGFGNAEAKLAHGTRCDETKASAGELQGGASGVLVSFPLIASPPNINTE
jgi:hypothetical protein